VRPGGAATTPHGRKTRCAGSLMRRQDGHSAVPKCLDRRVLMHATRVHEARAWRASLREFILGAMLHKASRKQALARGKNIALSSKEHAHDLYAPCAASFTPRTRSRQRLFFLSKWKGMRYAGSALSATEPWTIELNTPARCNATTGGGAFASVATDNDQGPTRRARRLTSRGKVKLRSCAQDSRAGPRGQVSCGGAPESTLPPLTAGPVACYEAGG
jgi:hypothetical protein